jgi:uncharacterized protein YeaO (DUF488 family)
VKGQDSLGKLFAPTWEMVMGVKNGTMSQEEYTRRYVAILSKALTENNINVLSQKFPNSITLVCFCSKGAFCHRVMLARVLETFKGFGQYKGER